MARMRIRLDAGSTVPVSTQLRAAIVARIDDGRLPPGDRLPTVRRLAADLGLAANTVARAYRELEEAGYVVGRGRHGTFVTEVPPAPTSDALVMLGRAARAYARRARQLRVDTDEALEAVERALRSSQRD